MSSARRSLQPRSAHRFWRAAATVAALFLLVGGVVRAEADSRPLAVDVWTPPFNTEHRRVTRDFVPPTKASRPWRICAVIPHLKDDYWLAVNFGLVSEAKRLGVSLNVYEAGGYENVAVQRRQIADCIAAGSDALVIGAVSATALNDLVEKAASQGVPVIDLINGIASDKLTARVAADFYDMGFATGSYVRALQTAAGRPLRVAWFPGPAGAGWVNDGDAGFRAALAGTGAVIVAGGFGDTGVATQSRLVAEALAAHPDLDVIAGTAVTAEAAVQVLQKRGLAERIKVLAYYFGPAIGRAIRRGLVLAAPSDRQALLARLSLDQAVNALEKRPIERHIAATITMIDDQTIETLEPGSSLAPLGFRPILSVGP
ncbi:MAG: TMAO reductase system periplasmic protein TorT [Reyranellaceae bacterium]